ncbi:MAG: ROK family protein [Anaerolineales bacterium]|nr:ROK family protein [Anaerolineales bacterium]
MSCFVAVDIGGTQIRAASYPQDSLTPYKLNRMSTQAPGSTPLERLIQTIASIWPVDDNVLGIGIAIAGPVDPYRGIVLTAPNIPGWEKVPLKELLQDKFKTPVCPGNDANLAALGEWKFGAGKGHHNIIYMTISTGIGGGIIIDDRLLLGEQGLATEIGHIIIDPDGPMCGCGGHGHLEAMASGPAIARWVEQELEKGRQSVLSASQPVTARDISMAASQGDELALNALHRAGTIIGIAIVNFLHIFNPSMIILGGGVSQSKELLFEPIRAYLRSHVMTPNYLENLSIVPAVLGDESGLMGALALVRQSFESTTKS